jgi:hypothetical protein
MLNINRIIEKYCIHCVSNQSSCDDCIKLNNFEKAELKVSSLVCLCRYQRISEKEFKHIVSLQCPIHKHLNLNEKREAIGASRQSDKVN